MFFPFCFCLLTVNDTLDEIFEDSGDEEESQDIVNQVLDEIGIEISGKVRTERLYGYQSNHGTRFNKQTYY